MHLSQPPTLLSLLFLIFSSTHTSDARPSVPDDFKKLLEARYHYLSERQSCSNPCGWIASGPLCCASSQTCSNGVCVGSSGSRSQADVESGGTWEYYTTTYTETDLVPVTSTYSSYFAAEPTTPAAGSAISAISCSSAMGESPCGSICCATGQYCAYSGQCLASSGGGESSSAYVQTTVAATNTAPLRATSLAATTVTSTGSATTTVPFESATAASTSGAAAVATTNNGLSGGEIAGIVIGVLAAVFLLLLLGICFCFRGLGNSILTFFGLRPRRRRVTEETVRIERHSHHGSGAAAGGAVGRRWYGLGPSRIERPEKKSSGIGGITAVAGGLTALAIFLGLKRRRDAQREKSEYGTASSYSYEYDTSESSASSDDRYERRSQHRSASRRG